MKGVITIYAIGKRIKALRIAKGMTQEELGKAIGTGRTEVDKMESSGLSDLSVSLMRRLSEALDVFPVTLLYETVDEFWNKIARHDEPESQGFLSALINSPGISELLDKDIGKSGVETLSLLSHINRKGVDQARAYIDDLVKIDDYRRLAPCAKTDSPQLH